MIEVRYRCRCMDAEVGVSVRSRTSAEDVVFWVEQVVGHAIARDHRARSPACRHEKMEYAKIPVPENAPFLGGEPRLNS